MAGERRLWYVADAFRAGWSVEEVNDQTAIDPWFLAEIEDLVATEQGLASNGVGDLDDPGSRIARIVAREDVTVRKPEKGTRPKLFYVEGDEACLNPDDSGDFHKNLFLDGGMKCDLA